MFEMIHRGGQVMIPILLCSVIALAVLIERAYFLQRIRIDTQHFLKTIFKFVRKNQLREAVQYSQKVQGPIAAVIRAGLVKHDRPQQEIREAVQDAAHSEIPLLEQNIGILATISHIAPLMGLLGTVTGLVRAFQVIQQKSSMMNPINPGDLAGGIWEALLTTVAGLTIAIPVIVAHNYLLHRVTRFVNEMEKSSSELLELLVSRGAKNEI